MLNLFKKHISLLLVAAMVLSIVCVPGILPVTSAAESAQVNLLTNPGFESRNPIPGWNTNPNPAAYAELSADYVQDGSYSMQLSGTGKWLWSDKVNVTAGEAYVLSAKVLADAKVDGAAIIQAFIRFYDSSDTKLSQTTAVTLTLTEKKGTWEDVSVNGIAPAGATKADVLLVTTGSSVGTVHFDNVKFSVVDGDNLLRNASFDNLVQVSGWSNPGGVSVTKFTLQSAEQVKSGSYALKIVDENDAGGYQYHSDPIKAVAGEEYGASVAIYGAGTVQMVVRYFNDAGTQTGAQTVATGTATGSWTTLSAQGVAPEGTTNIRMLLCSTGKSTGTAYFDDVTLYKIDKNAPAEEIDPSAIIVETFDDTTINDKGIPANWLGHETGPNLVTYTLDSTIRKGDSGYSLKMEKSHTATRTIYIDKPMKVEAGKTYRAELDYYGTATCQFFLQTFTSGYSTVDSQNVGQAGINGQWIHLTNEFVASSDADIVRVVIGLGGTTTGTVYFDNVKLAEVTKEEAEDVSIFTDDFEDSTTQGTGRPTSWLGTTDGNVTYSLENNVEGLTGKTLKQVKTGSSTRALYVDIRNYPVEAGKTYRAEMDVFVVSDGTSKDIGKSFQFYLQTYTAGHASKIDSQDVGNKAVEGKWVHLTNEITATADAAIIRVLFGLGGSAEGTVYIDNISLIQVGAKEEDGNLLANPSFEDDMKLVNWTSNNSASTTIVTDYAKHGANSLRIVDSNPAGGMQVWSDKINITAGKEYVATGYVYDVAGETDVQLYLRYFDISGKTRIDQKSFTLHTASGKWEELTVTLTAPSDAVKADVLVCTTGSTQGTVFFDSISLNLKDQGGDSGETPGGNTPGGNTPGGNTPSQPVDPNAIIDETFDNTAINDKGVPNGWQGTVDSQVQYTLDSTIRKGDTGYSLKLYKVDGTTSTRTVFFKHPGKEISYGTDFHICAEIGRQYATGGADPAGKGTWRQIAGKIGRL